MPYYESQPTIYPLHRLLAEVLSGELRVPRFQRPGTETTWSPEQRGDLLDSIYRNFPIGTILTWSTGVEVGTLEVVGGARVPRVGSTRHRLVLDGHQRLSSLIAVLGLGEIADPSGGVGERERWGFDLSEQASETPSRTRFRLIKGEPEPTLLPLGVAYDRVQLNRWLRERQEQLTSAQVRMADELRDRLREYSLPVGVLAAETLDEATESFKRINSSGTPMDHFHMVTALAYASGFDPQQRFAVAREEHLSAVGWAGLDDLDLLRVCAGLLRRGGDRSQHPSKIDIDALARSLRADRDLIQRAARATRRAVDLLAGAGVHSPQVLPYSWQLILLAIALGARGEAPIEAPRAHRWLWLTTYGAVFSSVNSAIADRAAEALDALIDGGGHEAMARDVSARVEPVVRLDLRAARSRAAMLALAREMDGGDPDGAAHHLLAVGGVNVQTLSPGVGRSVLHNLLICEPGQVQAVRAAARGGSSDAEAALLAR
ncbi:MAG TPA: DUF262 domain-containing protein, partial [Myxococcota bacterium]|nr:DUF262 domain-containing protein [Myxococcota bacterium]